MYATRESDWGIDFGNIAVECATALTIVRALDVAVFTAEHHGAYTSFLGNHLLGRTVSGLTLAGNSEVHPLNTWTYHVDSIWMEMVGETNEATMQVMPVWQDYADLPAYIRDDTRTAAGRHRDYQSAVGGPLGIRNTHGRARFLS